MSVRYRASGPDSLEQLMGKPSELKRGRCAVCGAECEPTPTAILRGMPDLVYRNGMPARNPRIGMCQECASLHAEERLHFRWVETESTLKGRRLKGMGMEFVYVGGHWEWRTTKEPMPMQNAWRGNAKWSRLR